MEAIIAKERECYFDQLSLRLMAVQMSWEGNDTEVLVDMEYSRFAASEGSRKPDLVPTIVRRRKTRTEETSWAELVH